MIMAGRCRQRSLAVVEFAHVHELLHAADIGEATARWPPWFLAAYERGAVGLGPGLACISVCKPGSPLMPATIANRDDILVCDKEGGVRVFDQTKFDEQYEVLEL